MGTGFDMVVSESHVRRQSISLYLRGYRSQVDCLLNFFLRPEIRRDYPLNLSISISGGKETNKDSLSNGE